MLINKHYNTLEYDNHHIHLKMEYIYLSYPLIGNLVIMIIIIYKDSIFLLVKSYFENNSFSPFHKSDILNFNSSPIRQ